MTNRIESPVRLLEPKPDNMIHEALKLDSSRPSQNSFIENRLQTHTADITKPFDIFKLSRLQSIIAMVIVIILIILVMFAYFNRLAKIRQDARDEQRTKQILASRSSANTNLSSSSTVISVA